MAHSLSAKKRIRQNLKRRARNRARKEAVKADVKAFLQAAVPGADMGQAEERLRKASSRLAKVAAKHAIHKNAAARKRSRLTKKLNALKAAAAK